MRLRRLQRSNLLQLLYLKVLLNEFNNARRHCLGCNEGELGGGVARSLFDQRGTLFGARFVADFVEANCRILGVTAEAQIR
ncbi:hypothetical protein HYQ46_009135 [Verticillium longisporum]|nr:hypothetical protein HYQ46_009135 [Verticillium longisporum]